MRVEIVSFEEQFGETERAISEGQTKEIVKFELDCVEKDLARSYLLTFTVLIMGDGFDTM